MLDLYVKLCMIGSLSENVVDLHPSAAKCLATVQLLCPDSTAFITFTFMDRDRTLLVHLSVVPFTSVGGYSADILYGFLSIGV